MEPRLDVITLGVRDVEASRRFYCEGLGWPAVMHVPGVLVFIQVGHSRVLSLFGRDALAADAGVDLAAGTPAVTLAQSVETREEVIAALADAEAAGATITRKAEATPWGAFNGYFADPDGIVWEVAVNQGFTVEPDGTMVFTPPPRPE